MISEISETELKELLNSIPQKEGGVLNPQRLDFSPEESANGLAKLALMLVNLLKEVMEKQAMRKMDNQNLTDEQIEKLGITFMLLDDRMSQLKSIFNLTDEDLKIKLEASADL